ncbi:heme lyase CcmF/NrfE family subunit [Enterovirga aerilata]|uniref:Heme lyase CcmF/NrfE family subunit n=1 Tax=Enterovirga aerilata TaxID=2730920 RepID=A0A849IFF4_9HYPH|nr:heme lyase CcmF/NrfE family subunit [Enterovirga sp. DB1703]NNM72633.1 heme lyase CcmF/NrfE family subunit [Enterovirga sp. DB1703]
MIVEAGHYALALALGLSVLQGVIPFWGARANDPVLMGSAAPAAIGVAGLVGFAFVALLVAYVTSDFTVLNVVENSHSAKPMIYKITGVWGNHEGSMLLWVLILALFGAMVAVSPNLPARLKTNALSVQAAITVAFLVFILFSSNPFTRANPAPAEGNDLNPILQDIGLAIHPPLLYFGYVGFSMTFALAMAALIEGRVDAVWARAARPWVLLAWSFLTLGISMGSYWAYYELGWGGFWFWDPVENASLLPWLAGTALLHSVVVMEKREALKVWTILLAILTFSLSLLGTFLVRSGVLTSVHAFAVDPARGVFILAILAIFIGGSLAIFAWRAPLLRAGGIFAPISREGALILNNLLLASACATVLLGTLYPLALEALTGEKISVGAPYYNLTFLPLVLPLFLVLPFGQALAWKRGDLYAAAQRLAVLLAVAILVALGLVAATSGGPVLAPLAVGLGVFLVLSGGGEIWFRSHARGRPLLASLRRAAGLPRAAWGSALAHAGLGVTIIGIAAQAWSAETIVTARPGTQANVGRYTARLDSMKPRTGPNYTEQVATLTLWRGGQPVGTVESAKRFYPARGMPTTEAGILTRGFDQVYVSVGEIGTDGSVGLRLYDKPLVLLIWIGSLFMAAGGALSLTDRRLRVGVPVRARAAAPLGAAAGKPA